MFVLAFVGSIAHKPDDSQHSAPASSIASAATAPSAASFVSSTPVSYSTPCAQDASQSAPSFYDEPTQARELTANRNTIDPIATNQGNRRPNRSASNSWTGKACYPVRWPVDDDSEDGGIANLSPGAKVKAIQEDGAKFTLQFEDGSTVTLQLTDPGASVAVRDKTNRVDYLGWPARRG